MVVNNWSQQHEMTNRLLHTAFGMRHYREMEVTVGLLVCMCALTCTKHSMAKEQRIFVTVFTQSRDDSSKDMHLYISSSRPSPVNVEVIVPFLDNLAPFANMTLQPGQRQKIILPPNIQIPTGTLTSGRTVRVVAENDITVMAANRDDSNVDMYQVREVAQLGKEYIVVTPEAESAGSASTVAVVSPYPDTKVKVTLPSSFTSISAIIDEIPQSLSREFSIVLKENQTFQIQSANDLSGTHILSDKPVAVVAGVNRTGAAGFCLDGQVAQLLSLDKLGTQYIAFGFPISDVQDYIQVVSTQSNTDVKFNGTTVTLSQTRKITRLRIDRNQFMLLETSSPAVVAISSSSGKSPNIQADVSMFSLLPLPLSGLQYTITIPDEFPVNGLIYLVLMVENDGVDDILLDDVAITGATWQSVEGTNISACYHQVTDNMAARVLRHRTGKPFAVYLQGFDYCQAYSMVFEPYESDVLYRPCSGALARDVRNYGGRRMTSQRMKSLTVEFLSVCYSHCLRYIECMGVNFSTEVTPGDTNCQLLFTETDGQVDTGDWTYYRLIPN